MKHAVILMVATLALAGCSDEGEPDAPTPEASKPVEAVETVVQAASADAYPIDYCVVSGEKLGSMGDVVEVEVEGRTVKLCCDICILKLESDPATYLAKLDAAAAGELPSPSAKDDHTGHEHHNHVH